MTLRSRGLLLAVLHIAIVLSVGAKLLYDRATRPRVWVETIPIDPQLPIRGRYIRLQLVVTAPDIRRHEALPVKLKIDNDRLIAEPETDLSALSQPRVSWRSGSGGEAVAVLSPPVAFFLPEHAREAVVRAQDEKLWVEVTVPKAGLPRPIRLGVKKGDAPVTPLDIG